VRIENESARGILDVYRALGGRTVEPRADGDRYSVRCVAPDHHDVHPSLRLWRDGKWFCWPCDETGGVLDLVLFARKAENLRAARTWLKSHGFAETELASSKAEKRKGEESA